MRVDHFSIGNGGWVRVLSPDLSGPLYVRALRVGGRFRIAEVYVDGAGSPIAAGELRAIPLHLIEANINEHHEHMEARAALPAADLHRLAAHYATTFGTSAGHWVAASFAAQIQGSGVSQAPMPSARTRSVERLGRPRIMAPDGLSDAFLGDVAQAYLRLVSEGDRKPAVTIAAEARVVAKTVHKWIALARKRGLLPAATKGRAG